MHQFFISIMIGCYGPIAPSEQRCWCLRQGREASLGLPAGTSVRSGEFHSGSLLVSPGGSPRGKPLRFYWTGSLREHQECLPALPFASSGRLVRLRLTPERTPRTGPPKEGVPLRRRPSRPLLPSGPLRGPSVRKDRSGSFGGSPYYVGAIP